jgi:5-methylcytosine-specific restriction protein A
LNDLQSAIGQRGAKTLRNPNGVYLKLTNFRRFDPLFTRDFKTGLACGNRRDKEIWDEFHDKPENLARAAAAIRANLSEVATSGGGGDAIGSEEEQKAVEGTVLTAAHRRRERSRKIADAKKG